MPRGATLPELVIVILMLACLAGLVMPSVYRIRDRAAARGAGTEIVSLLSRARHLAIARRERTAVRFNRSGTVMLFSGADTFVRRDLRAAHGVSLTATRDSIAFSPTGRGFGAANTTVIVRRGAASDTIVVSRLGRVRR